LDRDHTKDGSREGGAAAPPAHEADRAKRGSRPDALDRRLEALVQKQGTPYARGEVLLKLAAVNVAAETLDRRHAEDRYLVGESLYDLCAHGAHLVMGDGSIGPFVKKRFGLGRTWAYESMRVARMSTRADIAGLAWHVLELGCDLAEAMKLKSLGELKAKPLPVPGPDGAEVRFPTSPEHLEACLKAVAAKEEPDVPEDSPASVRRLYRRAGAVLQSCLERDPALAAARPRLFIRNDEVQFDNDSVPLRSEAFAALTRAMAELRRTLESER